MPSRTPFVAAPVALSGTGDDSDDDDDGERSDNSTDEDMHRREVRFLRDLARIDESNVTAAARGRMMRAAEDAAGFRGVHVMPSQSQAERPPATATPSAATTATTELQDAVVRARGQALHAGAAVLRTDRGRALLRGAGSGFEWGGFFAAARRGAQMFPSAAARAHRFPSAAATVASSPSVVDTDDAVGGESEHVQDGTQERPFTLE
jgi:hypothetical protein